jgi:glycosyltransferase involved in cell wall biosynthesis
LVVPTTVKRSKAVLFMDILLFMEDIYNTVGGGQTVYKKIIESSPEINFFYFRREEPRINPCRPANAKILELVVSTKKLHIKENPLFPVHCNRSLNKAAAYAESVSGRNFDIVETADYDTIGPYVRDVCRYYNVGVGRTVLSMHGNISTSIRMNWIPKSTFDIEDMEIHQFRAADGVYCISQSYMREWMNRVQRSVAFLSPLHFITRPSGSLPAYSPQIGSKPNLCCIGRMEKCKGNDIFIELTRWLPREFYGRALHIGDDQRLPDGRRVSSLLRAYAEARGDVEYIYCGRYNSKQLAEVYTGKNLLILPVRYDSLNLVALEALFHGCPVAISDKAGVCTFLDEILSGIPYSKIQYNNLYSCVAALRSILQDYDRYRMHLHDCLNSLNIPIPVLDMRSLYQKFLDAPPVAYAFRGEALKGKFSVRHYLRESAGKLAPEHRIIFQNIFTGVRALKPRLLWYLKSAEGSKYRYLVYTPTLFLYTKALPMLSKMSENSINNIIRKLEEVYRIQERAPLLRIIFWKEIARLEELCGNDLLSAVYKIRIMRALGDDRFNLLPYCTSSLEKHGYSTVVPALRAMYADKASAGSAVYTLLTEARANNRNKPDLPYAILEDRRGTEEARVSVIVSLYNAASKLNFFLTALAEQTMFKAGHAELIIQDSASPLDEKAVLDTFLQHTSMPVVYGRAPTRESIQCAWNRGIKLAHAPYIVLLGVDEGLYPDALDILAGELDKNPQTDWVMGDSLVMDTDSSGVLDKDVMLYRREGATRDHVYLETCYLSWVGGMYRKSIHDRFGWYDESFRGAGDTEFKNRVLPHIHVTFIAKTLGIFFNYPEERTTASPLAEIEDSRAWYLHRTEGGVRYAFENRASEDVKAQLLRTLGYRKSYCGHISTDFDYGALLAHYGCEREDDVWWHTMSDDMYSLRNLLLMQELGVKPGYLPVLALRNLFNKAHIMQKKHEDMFGNSAQPMYNLFNDNRYEQHSWLWKTSRDISH